MSSHKVPTVTRNPLHAERHARNAMTPEATAFRRYGDGYNHVLGYCKKQWTTRASDMSNLTTPSSFAVYVWNARIHTGEGTDELWAYVGLVKTSYAVVLGSPPEFVVNVYPAGGGALVSSGSCVFNQQSSSAPDWDDIHHTLIKIDGLSANTAYELEIQETNGARAVYMSLVEGRKQVVSTATTGVTNPGLARVEGDITDDFIADLVDANNKLWRHNKAPLFCWSCDHEVSSAAAGVPVLTGATANTYADVWTNRLFTLDTRYHATLMRTGVPVTIAVSADRTAGAGTLLVRLYDGTNAVALTGIGDGGSSGVTWFTGTTTMPIQLSANWRLQYAHSTSGGTTHSLYAVIVFPYET